MMPCTASYMQALATVILVVVYLLVLTANKLLKVNFLMHDLPCLCCHSGSLFMVYGITYCTAMLSVHS